MNVFFFFQDLIGTSLTDLCHPHDLSTLTKHLNETRKNDRNTVKSNPSVVYRLRVSSDKFLKIQTKSRFFQEMNNTHDNDYVMAINSIIGYVCILFLLTIFTPYLLIRLK